MTKIRTVVGCGRAGKTRSRPGKGRQGSGKKVLVEYLYLDLKTCDRCIGTDNVLDEVVRTLAPAFESAGFGIEYRKTEIKTAELAVEHRFYCSPTIRVNGRDICPSVKENSCGCCSEISGADVDCRVFEYGGRNHEVPPKEMLAEAILRAVFGEHKGENSGEDYKLPENLKAFFEGKISKSACSCGDAANSKKD
ncbi:MAG: DUF2703 domain-containing protein [Bacillota bacterium]